MIRYLKRNEIDIEKYDTCIEHAHNSRIYAYSWYLDIIADNWGVLVLDDYQAVMPLPFLRLKQNFFLKKITQPPFCQQLGVFSNLNIQQKTLKKFTSCFLSYKPKLYNFNSSNIMDEIISESKIEKDNYELNLSKSYQEIYNDYSKNLKRNIAKAKKSGLKVLNNIETDDFIMMKKDTKLHKVSSKMFLTMKNLIDNICFRNLGKLYGVYHGDDLIATAFFVEESNRIVHLFSASTKLGKEIGAISFLFDYIIKKNEKSNLIFDFEGSMIVGVAKFFKSFGANLIKYSSFQK